MKGKRFYAPEIEVISNKPNKNYKDDFWLPKREYNVLKFQKRIKIKIYQHKRMVKTIKNEIARNNCFFSDLMEYSIRRMFGGT
jgi:hypothetical protein